MNGLKQAVFLPKPTLTEKNLPNQAGRVFIVTGGYAGVGEALSKILYQHNGTVYIAGRSAEKADKAIASIKSQVPTSSGSLNFLKVDLADLASIKPAVEEFLQKESKLDVLVNNAGVMFPPLGSKSAQGHELTVATNCLGPFLFTKLLTPTLQKTAAAAPVDTVRVAWAGSSAVDILSPKGGAAFDAAGNVVDEKSVYTNYGVSKTGNLFLANAFARRSSPVDGGKEIISVAFNPGNLKSELQRHVPSWQNLFLSSILFPAVYGAYTELWCGWSDKLTKATNGSYVWPWGRPGPVRADITKQLGEGGNADKFWQWCEKETQAFA